MIDLIIRNTRVINADSDSICDVAIADGQFVEIAPTIDSNTNTEIDASGLIMLPGLIDAHVHFNEPGRTEWEGIVTGSQALAKGGVTSFFDMPLNSSPVTNTVEAYDEKRRLMDEKSLVNGYLWGGLTPDNIDHLQVLADRGVIGFKAFMSNSGIDEFTAVDDDTLYHGMQIIAETGKILALHAENDSITSQMAQRAISQGQNTIRSYLDSRPIIAELEAIQRVIFFASQTGCKVHIVHVSSSAGVDLVTNARQAGVDITCETCPHYLVLSDEDVLQLGAVAKCAPPLRSVAERDALWGKVLAGEVDFIASDHSPAPLSMKQSDNFFEIWGGIASCQSTLSLMLTYGYHQRNLALTDIVCLTSANVAQRFDLPSKGKIGTGLDADFVLVDIDKTYTLTADDLAYKHPISPYIGQELHGIVHSTWIGGQRIYG